MNVIQTATSTTVLYKIHKISQDSVTASRSPVNRDRILERQYKAQANFSTSTRIKYERESTGERGAIKDSASRCYSIPVLVPPDPLTEAVLNTPSKHEHAKKQQHQCNAT